MGASAMSKAIGTVKDETSIGLARLKSRHSRSTIKVAIVKATRHGEQPPDDRYIREILILTGRSRCDVAAAVAAISRRLGRTHSWSVAIKTLSLVHRLLSDGSPFFLDELLFATRRGTRVLDLSDFRDATRSPAAWDFSAFVRTFAQYVDERLADTRAPSRQQRSPSPAKHLETDALFERAQQQQHLLDRFLACRPAGAVKTNRLVATVIYPLVKESYKVYHELTEIVEAFVERFTTLPDGDCSRVYDVFSRLSTQLEELERFYNWCRTAGVSRESELPNVMGITPKQLEIMDDFISRRSTKARLESAAAEAMQEEEPVAEEPVIEEAAAALPAPPAEVEEKSRVEEVKPVEVEADLLGLKNEMLRGSEQEDKLALALFDGVPQATAAASSTWDAFPTSGDWEGALVQSASQLTLQKPAMGGGLDMLLLDGMYSHAAAVAPGAVMGSESSVVGPAPGMLALSAPTGGGADPFAASLAVAPPSWVQMTEMERKQRLLVAEQRMWQQYVRDGMQPAPQPYYGYMGGDGRLL